MELDNLDPSKILVRGDWVLGPVDASNTATPEKRHAYYLVFLGPNEDGPVQSEITDKLRQKTSAFKGCKVSYFTSPHPGFVLNFERDWVPSNDAQMQSTLDLFIRELNLPGV